MSTPVLAVTTAGVRIFTGITLRKSTCLGSDLHALPKLSKTCTISRQLLISGCDSVVIPYFPIDGVGHRNDWEHIAVWVKDGVPQYVSASMHGDYQVKPASEVRWDGTHPKMIYNKDGVGSHDFRFANEDDDNIENATGKWFYGALVSWNGFPSTDLRNKLTAYDFGSATFALRDANFAGNLNTARGSFIPEFDINTDDGSPGNP
jgi:hypothetical protein